MWGLVERKCKWGLVERKCKWGSLGLDRCGCLGGGTRESGGGRVRLMSKCTW